MHEDNDVSHTSGFANGKCSVQFCHLIYKSCCKRDAEIGLILIQSKCKDLQKTKCLQSAAKALCACC
jgi:hypothetical protein